MREIIKTSLIGGLISTTLPIAIAMDGGNSGDKRGESIINPKDLEKHMLIPEVTEKALHKDLAPEIQRAQIAQDYFAFTCPSVDQIINPSSNGTATLPNVDHMGINFKSMIPSRITKKITFRNVIIGNHAFVCNYNSGDYLPMSYMGTINADCQIHYESEKFHEKTEMVDTREGPLPYYQYKSDNPQDINIICKKR